MFKNLSTKNKLFAFPVLIILGMILLGGVFVYYNTIVNARIASVLETEKFIQQILKGRISAYQFLNGPTIQSKNKVKADFELLNTQVSNLQQKLSLQSNRELCDNILTLSKNYIHYFEQLSELKLHQNKVSNTKEIKKVISTLVQIGEKLENEINRIHDSAIFLKEKAQSDLITILLTLALIISVIVIIVSTMIASLITRSLQEFNAGLNQFFLYLNRETKVITKLNDTTTDEFGQMATIVNHNIEKIRVVIEGDRKVIDDTIVILHEFEQGDLCQRISTKSNNPALQELTRLLNQMAANMETNIDDVLSILDQYSNSNFMKKVEIDGLKEHFLKLATGVNTLGDSITTMLLENKTNGLTLDQSSNILLKNVDILNKNSNESAAALEETAAALEEITSNIANNTNNIISMSEIANTVTQEASKGEVLANDTTKAMSDINNEVSSINEAITIIDQIAFQTNILSLNAAVEAATAGEAGKGFAVVAQEVRNLAARSAEAANDIKTLVQNATEKAAQGKKIADEMISGYSILNQNIAKTGHIVKDVEMASKEQLQGIEQINDAVNSLDRQTQQNAMIASQTHDVAVDTDTIAKLVVSDANAKEFIGKHTVSAKVMEKKQHSSPKDTHLENKIPTVNAKPKIEKTVPAQSSQKLKTINSNTQDDSEWASF